ncbi:MAG: hypothetical protein QG669_542 [Patescibacteria group bacterium]|nr:hypothetical protein [Patescibacteria group bacterium]
MTKEYETIIEQVLEAQDKGMSLATLLEIHPEKKGEYSDAWKFVEGINDYMNQNSRPDKKRFFALIESLPEQKPILSRYMPYFAIATPALVILFMVFSYTSTKNPGTSTVSLVQESNIPSSALFETSLPAETFSTTDTSDALMSKSVAFSTEHDADLDSSVRELQSAYEADSQMERESSISFTSASDYNNLSSLYE